MEVFNSAKLRSSSYHSAINQSGKGVEMDRYIYSNQMGEGIGSLLGNLFRVAVPIIGSAIKGIANIAKPHLKTVAREVITAGSKIALKRLSGSKRAPNRLSGKHREHSPKRIKKGKWRNL